MGAKAKKKKIPFLRKSCPFCGKPLRDEAVFCLDCGAKVNNNAQEKSEKTSELEKNEVGQAKAIVTAFSVNKGGPLIVVMAGLDKGKKVFLRSMNHDLFYIGRQKDNDFVLSDPFVSRRHALIRHENGRFILEDLESTNRTFVGGKEIKRHLLNNGDVIEIGYSLLLFKDNS